MIIDANNLILGRVATVAAKNALLGEKVEIVNCEKSVVTGNAPSIIESYRVRIKRGIPLKGPFVPRRPDMLFKRTIRGMLSHRDYRGKKAYQNIKCYIGVPENMKNAKFEKIEEADASKLPNTRYIRLGEICLSIGYKDNTK